MELWRFLGEWHPKLVQFPLVLLLAGLLLDGIGLVFRSARAQWAGLVSTAAGTVSLLFAFICGIYAEVWAGRAGVPQHPIELHELMANIASWGFVVLFAWRILLVKPATADVPVTTAPILQPTINRKLLGLYIVVGLLWYVLIALAAYLGGQLVFQYGAAVTGSQTNSVLSLSDLNTLASRQTDENLRYSEWMHHIFGWMTLGLAASLLAQALWPKQRKRLRWIIPMFLLAGGLFLFCSADLDLYRFTDPHQWRDREVQLHKLIATLMAAAGVAGFWALRKEKKESEAKNSKLVAVLALTGGSMLFTHVHTVAPYANVAAGVYIAHVVLGLVALAIGGTRVAQDIFPRWARQLALVFAGLMLIESTLLITYNEGLPWYIGYGRYDRWGFGDEEQRRQWTVAPFGDFRAMMTVNQDEGKVFVGIYNRFDQGGAGEKSVSSGNENNVTLTLDEPPVLLVTRGEGELAIPLNATNASSDKPGELTASNFQGAADFLKNTPYLDARLVLTINGKRMVGYFDPWVTPRITPVPPNETAKFICPMHDGVRAAAAGRCPVCGMDLIPIQPPRSAGELHDAAFDIKLDPVAWLEGDQTHAASSRFSFHITKNGDPFADLAVVHEQPIHLIVVSEDLNYFDHVHPDREIKDGKATGNFTWSYHFPRAGNYIVYADFSPKGEAPQVVRMPLAYDDSKKPPEVKLLGNHSLAGVKLALDEGTGKLIRSSPFPSDPHQSAALDLAHELVYIAQPWAGPSLPGPAPQLQVEMLAQPRTIYAGLHTDLLFRLSDPQGKPFTDLSPYLGAMGHCIIISEDTSILLHAHSEDIMGVTADTRGGPLISFGTNFPKPGRYRIWGQFHRGDQLINASFAVEVKQSPVSPWVIRTLLNE